MIKTSLVDKKYFSLSAFRDQFLGQSPFPYLVLDDFLEKEYFKKLSKHFQDTSANDLKIGGRSFDTDVESKKWISLNSEIPSLIADIIRELNTDHWIRELALMSNLPDLVATKTDNSVIANYHEMKSGGLLGSHVDHSQEKETGYAHVLNIILYIAPEWKSEYGGATLFYDSKGKNINATIEYIPNRAVIFLHTPYSFHGVNLINKDIKYQKRRTIYVDYYSKSYTPYKSLDLSFPNRWFKHGTTFVLGSLKSYLKSKNRPYLKAMVQYKINQFFTSFK